MAAAESTSWEEAVAAFVSKQLDLLDTERNAEIDQTRALQEGLSPKVPCFFGGGGGTKQTEARGRGQAVLYTCSFHTF